MLPAAPPQKRERPSEDMAKMRSRSAGRVGDAQGDGRGAHVCPLVISLSGGELTMGCISSSECSTVHSLQLCLA